MTNERKHQVKEIYIAILGGGPAGLQAACWADMIISCPFCDGY